MMTRLSVAILLCVCAVPFPRLVAQAPTGAPHPSLGGRWIPVDPELSDKYFSVGLSEIPGGATLTINQQPTRFTVTIDLPDEKIDVLLALLGRGRFYTTVVYRVPKSRSGGYGAGGAPEISAPMWLDDRFVIPDAVPSGRPQTMTYSLKGDLLQLESATQIPTGHVNTVTQLFKKAS